MFLYGMRLMSNTIKESSSGALKKVLETVTNNPIKAFLLGLLVTAVIQSSTATIVITAGLVAAGVLKVKQSVGIIFGANVGTTITGQIIRLIDLDSEGGASWLDIFKPSTLAPISLVIGVVLFIFLKIKNSDKTGSILIGFGILFSGLNTMSMVVSGIDKSFFEGIFTSFGDNPLLGYAAGAGVAFVLQSSSATIGILQTLSTSGALTFSAITPIIVGVYLGDSVTTAIVCFIGTKADAKRVAVTNLIFNFLKTVLVIAGVLIAYYTHLLDSIWTTTVNAGVIANTNSIFNVASALLLLPLGGIMVKLACRIVKDDKVKKGKYSDKLDAMSPVFFSTPALAFKSCYEVLLTMFLCAKQNIHKAIGLLDVYDPAKAAEIEEEEDNVDVMADRVSNYLVAFSPHISQDLHVKILDEYYKVVTEFERLSDHAMNIKEVAASLHDNNTAFSEDAKQEIAVLTDAIFRILDLAQAAFEKRDEVSAKRIEPLEEVVDDLVNALKENHLARLREWRCNVYMDTGFSNLMSDLERISDVCSNIGVATVVRTETKLSINSHDYISRLHSGRDENFNELYTADHVEFFERLEKIGKHKVQDCL
ncbi:MAG: Na/Pi cotransporter family protein [Clostridia bacterium]|nr:Na/Pi cotransporter family protein [Clostridia bacterium]